MIEPTVVFATDLLGDLEMGLRLATRLAADHAATLLLLHVVPLPTSHDEGMLHGAADVLSGDAERRLRALVPAEPGVPYAHVLEAGDPAAVIVDVARRESATLIVVEARLHTRVRRALTRSLPERLLASAPCPVVTYRPRARSLQGPARDLARACAPRGLLEQLDLLTALLNARVESLVTWMDQRQEAVARIAASASVRDGVATAVSASRLGQDPALLARVRDSLALELREYQQAMGALGVELCVDGAPLFSYGVRARDDEARANLLSRASREGRSISLPLDAETSSLGRDYVILAGARVPLGRDTDDATLTFTLNARTDFLRILGQPGPTESTETYAFDSEGLMLSNSRFPQQLQRMGLLPPEPGCQTARRLRVCEPTSTTVRASLPDDRPLTRMAADAIRGHDGNDYRGYLDYRGVEVVGAWRWIAAYGFGVAAEMDCLPS